jgi:hypothetical protein
MANKKESQMKTDILFTEQRCTYDTSHLNYSEAEVFVLLG